MPASTDLVSGSRGPTLPFWRDALFVVTLLIVGLVRGAGFLVPLVFAVLVVVLLTAVVDRVAAVRIGGWKVPRWAAHIVGIALIFSGFLLVARILSGQADEVIAAMPRYAERFEGILSGVVTLIGEENAISAREAVLNADLSGWAAGALGSAGGFLGSFLLVMLYVPFMIVERGPMRRKIAIAAPDARTASELGKMVHSISLGLRRYIGIKTFVSVLTGLFSYAVMKPLGLDFAETWAVLAFALNFIPSIGSVLGVVFPALVALVQFDSITPFLIIVMGCGSVQFAIGNILEPAITGRSLNISPLVVILSLTFWTTIWGVAGALLSVPIMVCLLIVCTHVPGLRGLAVLMSGDGSLEPVTVGEAPPTHGNVEAAVLQQANEE